MTTPQAVWTTLPDTASLKQVIQVLNRMMGRGVNRARNIDVGFAKGLATKSGNGSTKVFSWAHGLGSAPTAALAIPNTANANRTGAETPYVTSDATNITVTYNTAPVSGTNNLKWYWAAWV